ncbi:unnamed protein product [Blepharisma stoltei]|uniref:CHCH domain-containing protein n=1 Tax=Blepharisma stoltei TaxID=1481888 RepID=A0AAU9IH50_9CILI|nr:unnamed protein product [Blepharisma stoltei]
MAENLRKFSVRAKLLYTNARGRTITSLIGTLGLAYFYYSRERKAQISHDADLAKEFCPDFVRAFIKCDQKHHSDCRNEMLRLHDCVHRFKTDNQMDFGRL